MTDFGQRRRQLLKTGQKDLFHIGDDGDLEVGLARSYTVLTTGQHAGTFDITVNAKTHALSNNAVQDNSTGLMWARYVPDNDIGEGGDGKLYWTDDVNSEDIWEFVAKANSGSGLGGYTDWRVANRGELESIVDLGANGPCINTTVFPSTPSHYHWMATTADYSTTTAWVVSFNYSWVRTYDKTTEKWYVRLVRGGV